MILAFWDQSWCLDPYILGLMPGPPSIIEIGGVEARSGIIKTKHAGGGLV